MRSGRRRRLTATLVPTRASPKYPVTGYLFCRVNESSRAACRRQVSGRQPVGAQSLTRRLHVSAVGEIIEGKRTKKSVERLDFQVPKQKEKLRIGDGQSSTQTALCCCVVCLCVCGRALPVSASTFSGSGEKLGDIPRTGYQITRMKPADLKPLHAILFDRPGKVGTHGAG